LEKGILSPSEYKLLLQQKQPIKSAVRNTSINALLNQDSDNNTARKKLFNQ
jgi:hypothetical protein